MKLPNVERAVIETQKIVDYLLADDRDKAAFFKRFGFSVEEWEIFANALHEHAVRHEVGKITSTSHGTKYIIEGELMTPDGRNPIIRTVWITESEETTPRLVTAYPVKGGSDDK